MSEEAENFACPLCEEGFETLNGRDVHLLQDHGHRRRGYNRNILRTVKSGIAVLSGSDAEVLLERMKEKSPVE